MIDASPNMADDQGPTLDAQKALILMRDVLDEPTTDAQTTLPRQGPGSD